MLRWTLSITCIAMSVIAAGAPVSAADDAAKDARYYRQQAAVAYKQKNYAAALESLKKAEQLIPDHPSIVYGIASMYARLGNEAESLAWLSKTAEMGLALKPERDDDFQSLKDSVAFKAMVKRFE